MMGSGTGRRVQTGHGPAIAVAVLEDLAPDACDEQAGSMFVRVSGYGVQPPTDELYQPQVNFREVVVRDAKFSIVVSAFVAVQNVNLNKPLTTTSLSPSRVTWIDDDGSEAPGPHAAVAAPVAFIGRDTARTAVASFVSAASAALYSAFVRLNAFR